MIQKVKHYIHKYKYGKQTHSLSVEQLAKLMLRVKKKRKPMEKQYLGVDVLRDSSLLSVFYWTGLRLAEVVGDRKRNYKVSAFSKIEREDMQRKDIDWRKEPDAYIIRTSPVRPGIRKEDIKFDEKSEMLEITALALKHGKRDAPLKLALSLPFVDLILQQWERTKEGKKVWDLSREYAWEILKEIDARLYTHYYRLNRAMEFVKVPSTSPAHLLSWFGWKRLQTAYNYLSLGGRRIEEMSATMVEQYTGKKIELPPESITTEKKLVEAPVLRVKPKPKPKEEKSYKELMEMI